MANFLRMCDPAVATCGAPSDIHRGNGLYAVPSWIGGGDSAAPPVGLLRKMNRVLRLRSLSL
jgi:hypothetical protein